MADKQVKIIYHIAPLEQWEAQLDQPDYRASSLRHEGFIHCTAEPEKLEQVANQFYRESPRSYMIACIAVGRLDADLRWEEADAHLFPHIYGPLNRSAVVATLPFPRDVNNRFVLPPELEVQPT